MSDYTLLSEPTSGTRVELPPGGQLCVRFRRPLGPSRWRLTGCPGHVLPLAGDGVELHFLVFPGEPATLRLERRHPDHGTLHEVCELELVVGEPPQARELSGVGARTPRSASRRTA